MKKPEEVAQTQLDCYNNHDLDGFCSVFHDDIKVYNLIDDALILEGKVAFRERYNNSFTNLKVHADVVNRIVIGNKVIDHEHVSRINQENISQTVAIYEIHDEIITKVWFVHEN